MRGFYFITDRRLSTKPDLESVRQAIEGGAKIIQYREKDLPRDQILKTAYSIGKVCKGRATFIVNDYIDVALDCKADGVHIGQADESLHKARQLLGEGMIIGVTVHDIRQAKAAQEGGADYLAASPIFKTTTKADAGNPSGIELIRGIKMETNLPIAAIGGINEQNVDSVIAAGADMVCAISATVPKQDIRAAVKYFASKWTG